MATTRVKFGIWAGIVALLLAGSLGVHPGPAINMETSLRACTVDELLPPAISEGASRSPEWVDSFDLEPLYGCNCSFYKASRRTIHTRARSPFSAHQLLLHRITPRTRFITRNCAAPPTNQYGTYCRGFQQGGALPVERTNDLMDAIEVISDTFGGAAIGEASMKALQCFPLAWACLTANNEAEQKQKNGRRCIEVLVDSI
ncbi:hypothetical protein Esi_0275_0007 [Ectocarpus siliculosus]|uniref:Uncharacterized protein n=1 Tax=Ectocarpus siliculosus TaxID=2880 RepID=D7FUP4_ECTSI|nr:hypothetical protein Esi_0275_0007 [Ectocarpus siliculosus]|eukprot:CBJ31700.1 hypothetical protein Esi_0275_0007 [Ectocarpus siliculosus]